MVVDKAGQKGTGKWTSQVALDLGVPVPTITAAIDARIMSSIKDERVVASQLIYSSAEVAYSGDRRELIQSVHDALYASKICSYAQGMNLIRAGSQEWQWDINLREMARIWKGGCIIRARFLDSIMRAYERHPELPNLLLDYDFMTWIRKTERSWRKLIATAVRYGNSCSRAFGFALVFRQLPQCPIAAKPHASAARLLWRPHLPSHRSPECRPSSHGLGWTLGEVAPSTAEEK